MDHIAYLKKKSQSKNTLVQNYANTIILITKEKIQFQSTSHIKDALNKLSLVAIVPTFIGDFCQGIV